MQATDEQIDAACANYYGYGREFFDAKSEPAKEVARRAMRAALAAILEPQPGPLPSREELAQALREASERLDAGGISTWDDAPEDVKQHLLAMADCAIELCAARLPAEVWGLVEQWREVAGSDGDPRWSAFETAADELEAALKSTGQEAPKPAEPATHFEITIAEWNTADLSEDGDTGCCTRDKLNRILAKRPAAPTPHLTPEAAARVLSGLTGGDSVLFPAEALAERVNAELGAEPRELPTREELQKALCEAYQRAPAPFLWMAVADYVLELLRAHAAPASGEAERLRKAIEAQTAANLRLEGDNAQLARERWMEQASTLKRIEQEWTIEGDYAPDSAGDKRHPVERRLAGMAAMLDISVHSEQMLAERVTKLETAAQEAMRKADDHRRQRDDARTNLAGAMASLANVERQRDEAQRELRELHRHDIPHLERLRDERWAEIERLRAQLAARHEPIVVDETLAGKLWRKLPYVPSVYQEHAQIAMTLRALREVLGERFAIVKRVGYNILSADALERHQKLLDERNQLRSLLADANTRATEASCAKDANSFERDQLRAELQQARRDTDVAQNNANLHSETLVAAIEARESLRAELAACREELERERANHASNVESMRRVTAQIREQYEALRAACAPTLAAMLSWADGARAAVSLDRRQCGAEVAGMVDGARDALGALLKLATPEQSLRQVTRDQFIADPAGVLKQSDGGPVQVRDADGELRMTVSSGNHLDRAEWAALDESRALPEPLTDEQRKAALEAVRSQRLETLADVDLLEAVLRGLLESLAGRGDPMRWRAAETALATLDARKAADRGDG